MCNIAVICAHPDDEVLGVGGTVVNHVTKGDNVSCLILGEGMTSRAQTRDLIEIERVNKLQLNLQNVAKIIGFQSVVQANLPDNRFDSLDLLDIVKIVEDFISRCQPSTIYTHNNSDLNIDHQYTFQAVMTATRPLENQVVKELYTFETPSSTEWNFSSNFLPNVFINIEDSLDKKLQAIACYETEIRAYPHPRSIEALKNIAARWGTVCGVKYAEAFQLIRKIP